MHQVLFSGSKQHSNVNNTVRCHGAVDARDLLTNGCRVIAIMSLMMDDTCPVSMLTVSVCHTHYWLAAGDGAESRRDTPLMLAENMEAEQQHEQKLRAKRDLDAEDIRQLFESQNARRNDLYEPG